MSAPASTSGQQPPRPRRSYDSPVRQRQVAETRQRIIAAGAAIAHDLRLWDLRAITFRAVAERAGLGQRTLYRHFPSERALHDAVLQRLEQEAGVSYEGIGVDDVADVAATVFGSLSKFRFAGQSAPADAASDAEDQRRRDALVAAVNAAAPGWSAQERDRAAAVLDVLWSVPFYLRLGGSWKMDPRAATEAAEWAIGLLVDAIHDGDAT